MEDKYKAQEICVTSIQILGNSTLVSQNQVYFRTWKAVAIDTLPKETQEDAVTGVPLHLWLILRESKVAVAISAPHTRVHVS